MTSSSEIDRGGTFESSDQRKDAESVEDTRKGLKFLGISLGIQLVALVISTIYLLWMVRAIQDISMTILIVSVIVGAISFGLLIGYLVLLGISIFFFYRGKGGFNEFHQKNIFWTLVMIGIYLALTWILNPILFYVGFLYGTDSAILLGAMVFSEVLGLLLSISIIMFLVRELVQRKDSLMLTIGLTLWVASRLNGIMYYLFPQSKIFGSENLMTTWGLVISIMLTVTQIAGISLLILVLFRTHKKLQTGNPNERILTYSTAQKKKGKFSSFMLGFRNPSRPLIALFVIGLFFGIVVSVKGPPESNQDDQAYYDFLEDLNFDDLGQLEDSIDYDDRCQEGEEIRHTFGISAYVTHFQLSFYWQDEEPPRGYVNNPDTFSVEMDSNLESEEQTMTNEVGSSASIFFEFSYDSEFPEFLEDIEVTILLVEAGNMERQPGLGFLQRTDDHCDFQMNVHVWYYDELPE